MKTERLDKLLVSTGRWSRSEARRLVREGRVLADGLIASSPEDKYDASAVIMCVDGESVRLCRFVYIMLHKPAGVLSATEDGRGKTVLDLLPEPYRRRGLFPVGRLDRDTEGLLLLTDDGALAHSLLSPKKHVDKKYYARVEGMLTTEDRDAFAGGIVLGDGLHCLPAEMKILSSGAVSEAMVTLREGKFHQIKRMFSARGKHVLYLRRESMGSLLLDGKLAPGQWRELSTEEKLQLAMCPTESKH